MKTIQAIFIIALCAGVILPSSAVAEDFELASPDGRIKMTVNYSETTGSLSCEVVCENSPIIKNSPLGIRTDKANLISGLSLEDTQRTKIDETYTLPVGKVSRYINRANQLTLVFEKNGQKFNVAFRAYDDGIAFRYVIPGKGRIEITGEKTGFRMPGDIAYWGQKHPNNTGYENKLKKLDVPDFSLPLLCELKNPQRWVLLSQAATYGSYCIPHLQKDSGLLRVCFPDDQKEPIQTTLPFKSPWRVAVISPRDLSTIVEQTLFENLNPPTESHLRNAEWIQPGSASWDWFHSDEQKAEVRKWVDAAVEMDWEYHLVDAYWEQYVEDIANVAGYAKKKGIGMWVWKATGKSPISGTSPEIATAEEIEACFKKYASLGIRGVKVDFFDRLGPGSGSTADYEDTQMGVQIRDAFCRIAADYNLQLVLHGAAIPSGERRRWPHLLSTEAVKGQESNPPAPHDNCIAYIRNPVGPVDYSPTWFGKGGKSDAYQLSTSVIFESGMLLFADLHKNYLEHPAKSFLQHVPATWDEVEFLEGYPASHTVIARRKGEEWYVGGMTVDPRTMSVSLAFLDEDRGYQARIIKDSADGRKTVIESRRVENSDSPKIAMQRKGGFVMHIVPVD